MNEVDIQYKLLAGVPISIPGAGLLSLPALKDIVQMNISTYHEILSFLLIDKSIIKGELDSKITNFDIFYANCYHSEQFKDKASTGIELFFGVLPILRENKEEVFIQIGEGRIDHNNFDQIQTVIKLGNNISTKNEPEFKPANSKAQKLIEMILKNREKQPKPKEKMDLFSIVSGLAWKSNGLTLSDLFNMNIYQIYNGFHTTNNIDNYHHTISALYAGTIDGKQIKMSNIHWANKLK
ncbi:MAG: hypothetical protein ACQEXX_01905 [Bacillota bacterium]